MKPAIWVNVVFSLNNVRIFDSGVTYSFDDSRGGTDGSKGKFILVSSISKSVWVLLASIILQT